MRGQGNAASYVENRPRPDVQSAEQASGSLRPQDESVQRQNEMAAWMRALGTARYAPEESSPSSSQAQEARNRQARTRLESTYSSREERRASEPSESEATDTNNYNSETSARRVDYIV